MPRFDAELLIPAALVTLCVVVIAAAIYAGAKESEEWDAFSRDHACKVTQRMRSEVVTGSGIGVMPNSILVGYLIDGPVNSR